MFCPGFKIELVMIDYEGTLGKNSQVNSTNKGAESNSSCAKGAVTADPKQSKASGSEDNDDVFSNSDGEESGSSRSRQSQAGAGIRPAVSSHLSNPEHGIHHLLVKNQTPSSNNASKDTSINGIGKPSAALEIPSVDSLGASDIKAIAADASVFSFGDEEDSESE